MQLDSLGRKPSNAGGGVPIRDPWRDPCREEIEPRAELEREPELPALRDASPTGDSDGKPTTIECGTSEATDAERARRSLFSVRNQCGEENSDDNRTR